MDKLALYCKWNVKNDFAYVLQFFSLIFDSLGGVSSVDSEVPNNRATHFIIFEAKNVKKPAKSTFLRKHKIHFQ